MIMILASLGPIFSSPTVSAHDGPNSVIWPMEGDEHRLDSTKRHKNLTPNGTQASADWTLEFAQGNSG